MVFTNKEKQERFRKKETLKNIANRTFNSWLSNKSKQDSRTPEEIKKYLETLIKLPSKWNDEDYKKTVETIHSYEKEILMSNNYELIRDIEKVNNPIRHIISQDNMAYNGSVILGYDTEVVNNMKLLSQHIESAIKLAGDSDNHNAAAIMEVARNIGRNISKMSYQQGNNSMAICLAIIPEQYNRPDWFIDELSECLKRNLGKNLSKKLSKALINKEST